MDYSEYKEIQEYCAAKAGAYETHPFGERPICYKVMGKIFAQLSPDKDWYKATLKTNPEAAEIYRNIYRDVVVRGYHCPPVQQPYWNTINLYEIKKQVLFQMIDEAYEEVVSHLPKKEQKKLPEIASCKFIKTDGRNPDFVLLCDQLDTSLDAAVGTHLQREKYDQYNTREQIHDVILVYKDDVPVACGAYKFYDEGVAEWKRIFVVEEYRNMGLGKEVVRRLEADAKIAGFKTAILETGDVLEAACHMYKKLGYKVTENYGQYADMEESVCMKKRI